MSLQEHRFKLFFFGDRPGPNERALTGGNAADERSYYSSAYCHHRFRRSEEHNVHTRSEAIGARIVKFPSLGLPDFEYAHVGCHRCPSAAYEPFSVRGEGNVVEAQRLCLTTAEAIDE